MTEIKVGDRVAGNIYGNKATVKAVDDNEAWILYDNAERHSTAFLDEIGRAHV